MLPYLSLSHTHTYTHTSPHSHIKPAEEGNIVKSGTSGNASTSTKENADHNSNGLNSSSAVLLKAGKISADKGSTLRTTKAAVLSKLR